MRTTTKISLLLAVLSAALLVLNGVYLMSRDRTAPSISFPVDEITYRAGASYDSLLEGVTAWDTVDGDVSDTVRVREVLAMDGGRAMVVYVAKDRANNIREESRAVKYVE